MLAEVLWICPKCGALVMSVDRKRHRRWHKKNRPIPGPQGPQGPTGSQGPMGPPTGWVPLPKRAWDVWEKPEGGEEKPQS